jgi:flavin reductase (DIM6/NTAB) family NADH-FMN oxidoreductase RutF
MLADGGAPRRPPAARVPQETVMQIPTAYDQAMARKYPEQIAIAIARDSQGHHNPITLGWVMNTSNDPPMLAISIGLTRHSLQAVRDAGEFVISFPATTMENDVRFHGTKSGRDMHKLQACGTKTQPATRIDSVLLADAAANFECQLESELQTGDHVIFVGRVLAAHVNTNDAVRRIYTLGNDRFGGVLPG